MEKHELEKLVGKILVLDDYKYDGKVGTHQLSGRQIQILDLVNATGSPALVYALSNPKQSIDLGERFLELPDDFKFSRGKLSFERLIDGKVASYSFALEGYEAAPQVEVAKAEAKQADSQNRK